MTSSRRRSIASCPNRPDQKSASCHRHDNVRTGGVLWYVATPCRIQRVRAVMPGCNSEIIAAAGSLGIDADSEVGKAVVSDKKAIFRSLLPALESTPGARALVERQHPAILKIE